LIQGLFGGCVGDFGKKKPGNPKISNSRATNQGSKSFKTKDNNISININL
jgi:hypothetical protein